MAPRGKTTKPNPEEQFKDIIKCAYCGDEDDEYCSSCGGQYIEDDGKFLPATDCQGYTIPQPIDSEDGDAADPIPEINPEDCLTGTNCAECGAPQFETPSGVTCENGHGGAEAAEVVQELSQLVEDTKLPEQEDDEYVVQGITKTIKAESGLSCEIKDRTGGTRWYKFSYTEERTIPETADLEKEKTALWNDVNLAVDKQLEDTLLFLGIK